MVVKEISLSIMKDEEWMTRLREIFGEGKTPIVLVVRSFFKHEEWIDYLTYIIDIEELKREFTSVIDKHFHTLYVGNTVGIDLFAIALPDSERGYDNIDKMVELLEEDAISVFLSEAYLGRIQKQIDVFQNPFRSFIEFALGYAYLHSPGLDDIIEAVKVAVARADMRRRVKIDELSRELFYIIDREDIYTYYQPIIDVKTKTLYAHEALARGPKGSKLHRPDILFKVALYNDMLMDLDKIVRSRHIQHFKDYAKEHKNARLAINLGPFTPMFMDDIDKELKKVGLSRDHIIWEISEKTYIDDFIAFSRVIDFINSMGYTVAIDDFGAGVTTFKLIFSIHTHVIKLDMSLVRDIDKDPVKQFFVQKLIGCFYTPDTLIVVEGVETEKEFSTLVNIGYRYYQGYHLFRPAPQPITSYDVRDLLKDFEYTTYEMQFSRYFE